MNKQSAVDFQGVYLILAAIRQRKLSRGPAAAPGSRFLFISLFILSFLTFKGEKKTKWLQVLMKIRAIHHYLLGAKKDTQ